MGKRFLLLIVLFLGLICTMVITNKALAQVPGGVLVYPNVIELDFTDDSGKFVSAAVQVENSTNQPFRVRAYLENWTLDQNGKIIFLDKPDNHSLGNYVKFNPREFDLAPKQKQSVRLTAKLPEGSEGEFRTVIFFETVNSKQEIIQRSKANLNINVVFKARYGVTLYAYKGKISRNALLQEVIFHKGKDGNFIVATLKNEGNIHCNVEGELTLIPQTGLNSIKYPVIRYTILPSNTQKYRIPLPEDKITEGNYKAQLRLTYKDISEKVQVLEGQTDFSYNPANNRVKSELKNTVPKYENIKMTPENLAKPEDINAEIKLK